LYAIFDYQRHVASPAAEAVGGRGGVTLGINRLIGVSPAPLQCRISPVSLASGPPSRGPNRLFAPSIPLLGAARLRRAQTCKPSVIVNFMNFAPAVRPFIAGDANS
jgi:hypothetical protein